jgi:hypothetical protein
MQLIWYAILIKLFIICTPNAFFQVPYLWRNLDRRIVAIIHGYIFAILWYILYDTQIINVLFNPLIDDNKNEEESTPIQRMEMGQVTKEFTHRLGDGSK